CLRPGETVLLQGTGGASTFPPPPAQLGGAGGSLPPRPQGEAPRAVRPGAPPALPLRRRPERGPPPSGGTGGRWEGPVVGAGGRATFDQRTGALRCGGTMSILGVLTGTSGPVNTYAIFHRTLRVLGIYVGSVEMLERFCRAVGEAELHPIIDWVFPFSEAQR